jgi:hypothetical protein
MFQEGTNPSQQSSPLQPADLTSLDKIAAALSKATLSNLDFLKGLQEIETRSFGIAKNFGLTKSEIDNITKATVTATEVLIQYGASQDTAYKQQLEIGKVLGRNLILGTEAQKDLFFASQTSGQAADKIAGSFKNAGFSLYDTGKQMNTVVNTAREIGVNATIVSEKVLQNTSLLNKYNFQGGVEGLAKMAANAAALRIDMGDTLKFAEKVYSPEGAIEAAAALQRLGVAQSDLLDPLKLLDLAENDPTELQNQIAEMSKQFVKLNKDGNFEILPGAKKQLREIEQVLGFGAGELSKMALSSAELDTKLSKIKFPDFATEEQKKLLANITEMKDGQLQINVNGEMEDVAKVLEKNSTEEQFKKLLEQGEKKEPQDLVKLQLSSTDNLRISIEKLTNVLPRALAKTSGGAALLDISVKSMESMAALLEKGINKAKDNLIPGMSDIAVTLDKTLTSLFNQKDYTGVLSKTASVFGEIGGILSTNFKEPLTKLGESFTNVFSALTSANVSTYNFTTSITNAKTAVDNLIKAFETPNISLTESLERIKQKAEDTIITPNGEIELLPQDTIIAGTGLEFIKDLIKSPIQPKAIENIKNIGVDPIEVMKMVKNEITSTTKTPSEVTVNFKMSLDVSGSNAASIDTNKLMMVLNDQGVKEKIIQVTKEALTERGQKILYPS